MERVVPGHQSGNNSKRFIADMDLLVAHEGPAGRTVLGSESFLSVSQDIFQLLNGNENLSKGGINLGLPGVETGNRCNFVLVGEDVLEKGAENFTALVEAGACPSFLGNGGGLDGSVNVLRIVRLDSPKVGTSGRSVALDVPV